MQEKRLRFAILALVISLVTLQTFGTSSIPAFAQEGTQAGEVADVLNDIGEGESRILTSNWVVLPPGEQDTYGFVYDGDDQPINVWMNSIPSEAAQFQIWTAEQLAEVVEDPETEPIGVSTAITGTAGFMNWQGSSPGAGTYYVVVSSTGDTAAQYLLNISSPGLAADQPGATTGAASDGAQPAAPTATPTLDPNIATVTTDALNVREGPSTVYPVIVTVPNGTQMTVLGRNATNTWIAVQLEDGTEGWVTRSLTNYTGLSNNVMTPEPLPTPTPEPGVTPVPGRDVQISETEPEEALGDDWQVLGEGESRWYTLQHQGGELPVHIWMDVEPNEGAGFRVYSEENARAVMGGADPDDVDDIGRGTRNPIEPGYLFWRGTFEEAGTFYVLVLHGWEGDVYYSIHAAGPGLGRPVPQE